MTSPRVLLKGRQIRPKKQLGQNFLAAPDIAAKIAAKAGLSMEDTVLEIGAGFGALTIPLARCAGKVYAVETDRRVVPLLKTELLAAGLENVRIIEKDILQMDIGALAQQDRTQLTVVGNLPYHISSQVLVKLIKHRQWVNRAVLMFQKELAQRLIAAPGDKRYGRLTVMLTYAAKVERLYELTADQFFPKPKIDSTVLKVVFKPAEKAADDEELLFDVIKAAFGQRRKTVKNALSGSFLNVDPHAAESALIQAGIDPQRRAETLSVEEFIRLADQIGHIRVAADTTRSPGM